MTPAQFQALKIREIIRNVATGREYKIVARVWFSPIGTVEYTLQDYPEVVSKPDDWELTGKFAEHEPEPEPESQTITVREALLGLLDLLDEDQWDEHTMNGQAMREAISNGRRAIDYEDRMTQTFVKSLLEPKEPNQALREAAERYKHERSV